MWRKVRSPFERPGRGTVTRETAANVTFGDHTYQLDEFGFLDPPDQWDEDFAAGMAYALGIHEGLTEPHWTLVRYLRRRFVHDRAVPGVVFALIETGIRLREFRSLFPTGYHRGACKVAGVNYAFMRERAFGLTYENYTAVGQEYLLTASGFLADPSTWSPRFAHLVANESELPDGFTERHREIIRYLRSAYKALGRVPTVCETCSKNALSLSDLLRLFPDGYRRGACRMAGLPFYG